MKTVIRIALIAVALAGVVAGVSASSNRSVYDDGLRVTHAR